MINPPQGSPGLTILDKQQELTPLAITTTTLSDGEFISKRIRVPSGTTIRIWTAGTQNTSNNTPSGLTAEVDDETNSNNLVSENSKRSSGSPLAEATGPIDVAFRTENDTGSEQDASSEFRFTIE